jgi:hypothetical protein
MLCVPANIALYMVPHSSARGSKSAGMNVVVNAYFVPHHTTLLDNYYVCRNSARYKTELVLPRHFDIYLCRNVDCCIRIAMPPKTWFREMHALRHRKYCIVHGAAFVVHEDRNCQHLHPQDTALYMVPHSSAPYGASTNVGINVAV